ncbi:hypothetical protein FRB96_002309 [Tulasnella sp. 330]|nr:hypothetical protein FRB96_002309 [Tulasnella sp. 330]
MSTLTPSNVEPRSVQNAFSLTPLRGLLTVKKTLEEITRLVTDIAVNKSECKALVDQAFGVIDTIETICNTTSGVQLKSGILLLDVTLTAIRNDMQLWKGYHRLQALSSKYLEMRNRLKLHRVNMEDALASIMVAVKIFLPVKTGISPEAERLVGERLQKVCPQVLVLKA